jgi:hypothetical protein
MPTKLSINIIDNLRSKPVWTLVAAFGTYFCMYGFRKPFTASTYETITFFGFDYKFLLVFSQTLGYVLSKWIGIKLIAEIKPNERIGMLIFLIMGAEAMLLLFALIPGPWNAFFLFLNGLALGIIFGLVLGFLEGRRNTEALVAGLCASFIVSDGFSKSVGSFLLDHHVSDKWMPFLAGLCFMIPTFVFIRMLSLVSPPNSTDNKQRSARSPMNGGDRVQFFLRYAPGLIGIVLIYLFVSLLRSVRADFAPEIWQQLGYVQTPSLFTISELWVSFGVVVLNGFAIYILNHYKAFQAAFFTCMIGFTLLLGASWGFFNGLGKFAYMVIVGLGVYLPYVAVHTTIFERLISILREKANMGFLMYIADSIGYTGYMLLILFRHSLKSEENILSSFITMSFILGIAGILIVIFSHGYFKIKFKKTRPAIA